MSSSQVILDLFNLRDQLETLQRSIAEEYLIYEAGTSPYIRLIGLYQRTRDYQGTVQRAINSLQDEDADESTLVSAREVLGTIQRTLSAETQEFMNISELYTNLNDSEFREIVSESLDTSFSNAEWETFNDDLFDHPEWYNEVVFSRTKEEVLPEVNTVETPPPRYVEPHERPPPYSEPPVYTSPIQISPERVLMNTFEVQISPRSPELSPKRKKKKLNQLPGISIFTRKFGWNIMKKHSSSFSSA